MSQMSKFTRRAALVVIGGILVVSTLVATAQTAEPSSAAKAVAAAVESLRVAMVVGNEKEMNALTADHMTYGHSHGALQNKTEFIKNLVGPKAPGKFLWIKQSNQTIDVVGKNALVRHVFDCENELPDGTKTKAHILVLQVWNKEKGGWKLLARQACPLD